MSVHLTLGHHGFWGYSSFFDWNEALNAEYSEEPLNILLVHPGDIRHIVATVARRRRAKSCANDGVSRKFRPIHFYLLETPTEVLARDILLLEVLNDYEVPIRQRANIFLEIFGNCKVQDRTSRYVEQLGHELRALLGDGTGRLEGIVDFSLLKYRERDELEEVFKSYARTNPFDIDSLRDHRLRGYYADRYDSRVSLGDWDWHSTIKPGASIIHVKLFKGWRTTGIAFEFGDQVYDQPNRTMMSYTEGFLKKGKDRGLKKEIKGFWGDIVASPYVPLGIDTDTPNKFANGLFEILNKDTGTEQHRHNCGEIAVHNMFSFLWEIETGSTYQMTKANDIFSGLGAEAQALPGAAVASSSSLSSSVSSSSSSAEAETVEPELTTIPEEEEEQEQEQVQEQTDEAVIDTTDVTVAVTAAEDAISSLSLSEDQSSSASTAAVADATAEKERKELAKAIQRAECIVASWENVKIFPVVGNLEGAFNKDRFKHRFHGAFVSARAAQVINSEVFDGLLQYDAIVAIENTKFLVPFSASEKQTINTKIDELASGRGWTKFTTAPVFRRRRDERDAMDDVFFYRKSQAGQEKDVSTATSTDNAV